MSKSLISRWFPLSTLALCAALPAAPASAQTHIKVDVEGYMCRAPGDAERFQQLASTNPGLSRAAALSRFNQSADQPRCVWYERTLMIYKGALRETDDGQRVKHLFIGGDGGVFEVLVFETPESAQMLYSWRRTEDEAS